VGQNRGKNGLKRERVKGEKGTGKGGIERSGRRSGWRSGMREGGKKGWRGPEEKDGVGWNRGKVGE